MSDVYKRQTQAIGGISTLLIDGLAVEGRAAKQHYHIRILLYGAALAQVAQGGACLLYTSFIVTYTYICFSTRSSKARASPSTPSGMLPYR